MSKMSFLAKQVCENPKKPEQGLQLKKNGTYELIKTNAGKQKSFSSKDPVLVWEKYANFLQQQDESNMLSQQKLEEKERGPLFEIVAEKYKAQVEQMKNGTKRAYLPAIERVIKGFQGRRMKDIQPWEIKAFLRELGLAKTTTSNQKTVINAIYQLYIDSPEWHGEYNPAAMTQIPRNLRRGTRTPPSEAQIDAVKNAALSPSPDDLIPIVYLCTGGRCGEGCAIQLKSIDRENRIIHVSHAVEWVNNQPFMTQTKTEAGIRQIPLLKMLENALEAYWHLPPETYIIGLGSKPVTRSWYTRHWAAWWREKGHATPIQRTYKRIKNGKQYTYHRTDWKANVCAHQFRHEYVCMLCEANVPEEIAIQIIGHANAKMVHEVYMSLKPSMIQKAAVLMDNFLENSKANLV